MQHISTFLVQRKLFSLPCLIFNLAYVFVFLPNSLTQLLTDKKIKTPVSVHIMLTLAIHRMNTHLRFDPLGLSLITSHLHHPFHDDLWRIWEEKVTSTWANCTQEIRRTYIRTIRSHCPKFGIGRFYGRILGHENETYKTATYYGRMRRKCSVHRY